MRLLREKRGEEALSVFVLIELILAILVIFMVGLIAYSMANNATYYQSFYSKDNAYIAEALYGVPNGEMHIGYLWQDPGFIIKFNTGEVWVQSANIEKEGITPYNTEIKAFGTSQATAIDEKSFTPSYYEFIKTTGAANRIEVVQNLHELHCPASQTPLTGIAGVASEQGFNAADQMIKDIVQGVSLARNSMQLGQFTADQGLQLRLQLVKSSTNQTTIYYRGQDDQTVRLACVLSQGLSIEQNAPYTPNSPSQLQQYTEKIIIVVQMSDDKGFDTFKQRAITSIEQYWGAVND